MNILELHQLAAKEWREGNKSRAIDILEGAIQNNPENPWLIGEMGGLLIDMGRKGVGQALLTHACSMEKLNGAEDWRHWSTLASTLESLEQRDMAELAFQEAVRVDPKVSDIYDQWAGVYVNNGDPKRCIELSEKALSLNPQNVVAKKHLSLGLLEAGRWQEAWPLMESRKQIRDYQRPKYSLPEWTGQPVDTLILHGEQGIGDEIMYNSLLHRIRGKVRRLVVEVTPRLVPLMRRSLGQIGCEVYASLEEAAANRAMEVADLAPVENGYNPTLITITGDADKPSILSCASLPHVLGLSRQQALSPGYLLPDAARVDHWREKLEKEAAGRRIVGVTWEGGVRKTHKKVRNPPFEAVRDFIAAHPQYFWVSVQYTHGEIAHKSMPGTTHYQQAVDDLDEQAALISALDLLVSVPQTAVHIAGAMAVPTIAIVSSKPRWDFCGEGDQMPWWESVKMIRQQGAEWGDVFARLDAALAKRFPHSNRIVEAAE